MFEEKRAWGDHKVYTYDHGVHPFIEYFKDLYQHDELDQLHLKSEDFNYLKCKLDLGVLDEVDTDLHSKFYADIKKNATFKRLYCEFIKDIYKIKNQPRGQILRIIFIISLQKN